MTRLFSVFAGAAVATLLIFPAVAQVPGTTSGASSTSMTNVYPTTVPTTASGQVATDPMGYSPYNTHSVINETGIPRQAPALSLAPVYGLNPCSVGASIGVTTPVVGIGGAVSSADPACEARNNAALAVTAFHNEVLAREMLCQRKEWREAWKTIGKPCIEDQPAGQLPAPVAAAQSNAGAMAQQQGASRVGVMMTPQIVNPAALIMTTPIQQSSVVPSQANAGAARSVARMAHVKPDWCYSVAPSEFKARADLRRQCGA